MAGFSVNLRFGGRGILRPCQCLDYTCTMSNGRTIDELEKNLEVNRHGLMEVLSEHSRGSTEGKD